METVRLIIDFMNRVKEDPRIGTAHISIYVALWKIAAESGSLPFRADIRGHEVMPACKVSSDSNFYRLLRELATWGYIRYQPSYAFTVKSAVFFDVDLSRDATGRRILRKGYP